MKILGIDYGDVRTGLSTSDPMGLLAGNPRTIEERNTEKLLAKLVALIQTEDITEIVVGYPKNMNGTVGERGEKCEALANALHAQTGLPVHLWDERQTTVAAHAILRANGKKEKKHKKSVDAVAATLILQGYLDFQKR